MRWAVHGLQVVTRTQEKSQTHHPLTLCHPLGWQSSERDPHRHFSSSQGLIVF